MKTQNRWIKTWCPANALSGAEAARAKLGHRPAPQLGFASHPLLRAGNSVAA